MNHNNCAFGFRIGSVILLALGVELHRHQKLLLIGGQIDSNSTLVACWQRAEREKLRHPARPGA